MSSAIVSVQADGSVIAITGLTKMDRDSGQHFAW